MIGKLMHLADQFIGDTVITGVSLATEVADLLWPGDQLEIEAEGEK